MDSFTKRPKPNLRGRYSERSLPSRLSWSVVLIVIIAVASAMIDTLYHTDLTNTYLSNQISESVQKQTDDELTSIDSHHARDLDVFYTSFSTNMETHCASIPLLLSPSPISSSAGNWKANINLTRLPQGSWDNPNTKSGSIFVHTQEQLPDTLISEIYASKQVDILAPYILKNNPDMIALYFGNLEGETLYYPNIDQSAILPSDFDVTQRPWFIAAAPSQNPKGEAAWATPYQDAALNSLVVTTSLPVHDDNNHFRGVIAADIQLLKTSDMVASIWYGQTGYSFLLDKEGWIITMPESGYTDLSLTMSDFQGDAALERIHRVAYSQTRSSER